MQTKTDNRFTTDDVSFQYRTQNDHNRLNISHRPPSEVGLSSRFGSDGGKKVTSILKKRDSNQGARDALNDDMPLHPHTKFKSMSGSQFQEQFVIHHHEALMESMNKQKMRKQL